MPYSYLAEGSHMLWGQAARPYANQFSACVQESIDLIPKVSRLPQPLSTTPGHPFHSGEAPPREFKPSSTKSSTIPSTLAIDPIRLCHLPVHLCELLLFFLYKPFPLSDPDPAPWCTFCKRSRSVAKPALFSEPASKKEDILTSLRRHTKPSLVRLYPTPAP
ncbi:hypothetical protein QC761_0106860 [Podospora bellae-mahoneyi]|uniref:Uncharacterized protein n=1 Tax=Podospora bellae-mahoneyi TaxID=2093777 RepID=A0ABR0F6M1_9PEZI|nr:hypothetical protein QC761_0106860 [Podospora bellae-mahoneyi]